MSPLNYRLAQSLKLEKQGSEWVDISTVHQF